MYIDSEVLIETYELVDLIIQSEAMENYLSYKEALNQDAEVQELKKQLAKAKVAYEEVNRFGQYHPDYHQAKEKVDQILSDLDRNETIKKYKEAERALDKLLYQVAETLAHSISPSILVPRNDSLMKDDSLSCTTGGCGTCSLGNSCAIKVS